MYDIPLEMTDALEGLPEMVNAAEAAIKRGDLVQAAFLLGQATVHAEVIAARSRVVMGDIREAQKDEKAN